MPVWQHPKLCLKHHFWQEYAQSAPMLSPRMHRPQTARVPPFLPLLAVRLALFPGQFSRTHSWLPGYRVSVSVLTSDVARLLY